MTRAVGPLAPLNSSHPYMGTTFRQGNSYRNCAMWRNPLQPARKYFSQKVVQPWAQYNCGVAGIMGTENVFRLCSIFDPDLTGVGHFPYLISQWFAFYRKYIVTEVEITITVNNATTAGAVVFGQVQSSASTQTLSGVGVHTAQERFGIIGPLYPNLNGTGNAVSQGKYKCAIPALEGMSWAQYFANEDFAGTSTSNPTLTSYLRVASGDVANQNNNPCFVGVEIIYFGYLFDRIDQAMGS